MTCRLATCTPRGLAGVLLAAYRRGPRVGVPCQAKPTGTRQRPWCPGGGRNCARGTEARTARVGEKVESGRFRTCTKVRPSRDLCLKSLNALIPLPSTPRRVTTVGDAVRMRANRVGVTPMTRARASDNGELSLTSQLAAGLNNGGVS